MKPSAAVDRRPTARERIAVIINRHAKTLLLAPLLVLLLLFFFLPLLWLLRVSLYKSSGSSGFGIGGSKGKDGGGYYVEGTWTLDNYAKFFGDSYYLSILSFTVEFAVIVTFVTMILAYPMAYYIYKAGPRLKAILLILVILPKLSNMLVLVYGLQILLANDGLVTSNVNALLLWLGVIKEPIKLVYTLFSATLSKVLLIIPYTILVITAALHTLDPTLREASRGLGAGPARTFFFVTLPLSMPGTLIALLITIVWALGAFVSPSLLGNPDLQTLAVEVPKQTFENVNWAMGSALAFIMLAMMTLVVLAYNWTLGARMAWRG
jgi:ABC-type spermidine/putrescine transport system permease subunit I